MATPAAVIFDNDGLLLDTEEVWTRAERLLYARRGAEFTPTHKLDLVGTSAFTAGAVMAGHLGIGGEGRDLVAELDGLVFEELERGVEPMAGALELVADLRARQTPIALVSNSPRRFIETAIRLVGLESAFGVLVSGHEVPAPKPAPDAYFEACIQLGLEPSCEIVVLEDSPTGVAAAIAAGLTVYGIPSVEGVEVPEAAETFGSLGDGALRARLGLD